MNIQELMYDDPARADVTEWLTAHGWSASFVRSVDEMRRLDRWVLPTEDAGSDTFSTFVVAEKS
jgi:O-methyltransferase involved in polyketide biosynthesis